MNRYSLRLRQEPARIAENVLQQLQKAKDRDVVATSSDRAVRVGDIGVIITRVLLI